MILRQLLIGVVAGVVAILLLAATRPRQSFPSNRTSIDADDIPLFMPSADLPLAADVPSPLDDVIKEVRFTDAPLSEVIDFIARSADANVVVHWASITGQTDIQRDTPVSVNANDVTAADLLTLVLDAVDNDRLPLGWDTYDGGVVRVSFADDFPRPRTNTRIYDVRDLMIKALEFRISFSAAANAGRAPDAALDLSEVSIAQDLESFLKEGIDPKSWVENGGLSGMSRYWTGLLLIHNTHENHAQIERLLDQLRKRLAATP